MLTAGSAAHDPGRFSPASAKFARPRRAYGSGAHRAQRRCVAPPPVVATPNPSLLPFPSDVIERSPLRKQR